MNAPNTLLLIILDGFGYRKESKYNAITAAKTPNLDNMFKKYPHTFISGSGKCVGLPAGQMGNSEVGHMSIGAGRIIQQDLTRIDEAIEQKSFFINPILVDALVRAKKTKAAVHLLGLLSPGGVHSHEKHFHAMINMAASHQIESLYIHAFLDGRDTPPKSASASIHALEALCSSLECGKIASLIGRYYAMDRDKRWDRIQRAYELLTERKGAFTAKNALEGLRLAYERGESDEFVQPTVIEIAETSLDSRPYLKEGDVVIFMNFRADRAREITEALTQTHFAGFKRHVWPTLSQFICLTEYNQQFKLPIAFPPIPLNNLFGEIISRQGFKQLRIAETEKYAHVTFFFNGGMEAKYPLEDRILISSPQIPTYDLQPEMSAYILKDQLITAILSQQYKVIICNFANPDMVGHTGDFAATIKAIETIDECLGDISQAVLSISGELIITSDHGNAEMMFDPATQQAHTAHTNNLVPFIYLGRKAFIIKEKGRLSDLAPTMLYLLNLPIPQEMMGSPLVKLIE